LVVRETGEIDVTIQTGLAEIGGAVRAECPGGLKFWIHCRARVVEIDRVRLQLTNVGTREFPGGEYDLFFRPIEKKPIFPEIQFEDLKGII
jgi:hypothetical protein